VRGRIAWPRVRWHGGNVVEISVTIDRPDAVRRPVIPRQSLANNSADRYQLPVKIGGHRGRPHLRRRKVWIAGISATDEIAGGDGIEFGRIQLHSIHQIFTMGRVKRDAHENKPAVLVLPDAQVGPVRGIECLG